MINSKGNNYERKRSHIVKLYHTSMRILELVSSRFPNVPVSRLIDVAWPRCPACGSPVVKSVDADDIIVCVTCRRRYKLVMI